MPSRKRKPTSLSDWASATLDLKTVVTIVGWVVTVLTIYFGIVGQLKDQTRITGELKAAQAEQADQLKTLLTNLIYKGVIKPEEMK